MKTGRKERARKMARVDALEQVVDQLRKCWLSVDQHSGLEELAEPVEEALDAFEARLDEEHTGPGRRSGREAPDEASERLVSGSEGYG